MPRPHEADAAARILEGVRQAREVDAEVGWYAFVTLQDVVLVAAALLADTHDRTERQGQ